MINSIKEYLQSLSKELEKCDGATRQDALNDTEEHLSTALYEALAENTELSESDALAAIIEEYGTPKETAESYLDLENKFEKSSFMGKTRVSRASIFSRERSSAA